MRSGVVARKLVAMARKASAQEAGFSLPSTRSQGRSSRFFFSPSKEKRPRSAIHSSFTSSWMRGRIRSTSGPRVSMRILVPVASCTSMLSVFRSSQGRETKA